MPLIRLAKRILSISANSASCERLFSIFGNTLTKLRNRLGTDTLTNLAELKMFLRDQHLRRGTKKRLKNIFQGRIEDANHRLSLQPLPDAQADINIDPSLLTSSSTSPQFSANQSIPNPADSRDNRTFAQPTTASQDDADSDNDEPMDADPESSTARNQRLAGTSFRAIVNTHSWLTSEDEVDTRPVTAPLAIKNRIPIQQLFDFNQVHWVDKYAKHPLRSFDEELALYELLDLDAQGEDDADVDVDDTTGDILHG